MQDSSVTENTTTTSSSNSLMDKFKPAAGSWTCNSCLVVNSPDTNSCAACETPNPQADSSTLKTATTTASLSSFGKLNF